MRAETSLNHEDAARRPYIKIANVQFKQSENTFRFLYIGQTDDAIQALTACFAAGVVVENFSEARSYFFKEESVTHPVDIIFVDVALYKDELQSFCTFLKEQGIMAFTPIIYNERKLDFSNIKLLRSLQLIDDVVDLTSEAIDYCTKISFIRKIKFQVAQKEPASRSSMYGITGDALRHYAARQIRYGKKVLSFKRLLDVTLAVLALIILSPIFLLIAACIKLTSKGPVFYTQPRAGQGFRIFKFYKFRTMDVDADKKIEALAHLNQYTGSEAGALFFKLTNDPRINKFGVFLRNTSMDELPQLINVIKGDMSLVGNRPLPLYEAATLTTNEFVERFVAPAGITGLWQVKKRGRAQMSIEERINLDILYARRSNLLYDLRIMASTPAALWQKSNV